MARFKDIIREARQKRGWTQKYVAAKIGITDVAYGDYERGRIYPSPENLRPICNVLELDFDEMSQLVAQEKEQIALRKVGHASTQKGIATAFIANTDEDIPISIKGDPVLSSNGKITIEIDINFDAIRAKTNETIHLDLIDISSVKLLKTFDLPKRFLEADVAENSEFKPKLEQMKRDNVGTAYLRKYRFAYKIWWEE